jgi:hypothetical protein
MPHSIVNVYLFQTNALFPSSGSNSKASKEQQCASGKKVEPWAENPTLYKPKRNFEIHSEDGSEKFL